MEPLHNDFKTKNVINKICLSCNDTITCYTSFQYYRGTGVFCCLEDSIVYNFCIYIVNVKM